MTRRGDILSLPSGYSIQILESRYGNCWGKEGVVVIYQTLKPLAYYRTFMGKNKFMRHIDDLMNDGYKLICHPEQMEQFNKFEIQDGIFKIEIPEI